MTGIRFDYSTLKQAITKPSPLRDYLNETFPNGAKVRGRYKTSVGPILAPGSGANAGTVGTAFDSMVRLTLDPDVPPEPAYHGGFRIFGADPSEILGVLAERGKSSPEAFARVGWAFALFTEAYRNPLPPEALLGVIASKNPSWEKLLGLAPAGAVTDLVRLQQIAQERFYPLVAGPIEIGPAFDGLRIAADGDLVHDSTLIELKTTLGANAKGTRYATLDSAALYQLLAYVLLDTRDKYRITGLGLYSARYGHFARWDLAELLHELAGRPVDLAAERERVRNLIGPAE